MTLADPDSLKSNPPVSSGRHLSSTKSEIFKFLDRLYESPRLLLLFWVIAIFIAESAVMLVFDFFDYQPHGLENFIDATAQILILSPIFYYFFLIPLKVYISKLRNSESQNKFLSQQLILASEEERKNLARELHDEFGQTLTSLIFNIEALKNSLPSGLEDQQLDCDKLAEIVGKLSDNVRNFSGTLRPVLLDKLGIVAALQGHVEALRRQHPDLEIEFEALGIKTRPSPQIEIVLYRVCQEGLNNVIKHAQASKAEILLTYCHPNIILTLKDDGQGFDLKHQLHVVGKEHQGLGLLGMKERVETAGGLLQLHSENGKGTLVRTELPMN